MTSVERSTADASLPTDWRSTTRRLLDLALPIVGINVLAVLTLAVDTIMCGRLDNSEVVLTSLSFAVQIIFLLMVTMMGLTVGTVALVARAYGAKEHERVNRMLAQSVTLTVLLGLVIGVVGNLLARPMMLALGASGEVADVGLDYLRPLLAGTTFYYLVLLYGGVLRGVGNTRLPFMVAMFSNALNVALDYGLILGELGLPELGVRGAAYGTLVAYAVNVVLVVALLRRGAVSGLRPPLWLRRIDRKFAVRLLRVGAPAALDMLILNLGFVAVIGMLGHIDELAVAAHGVGLRVQALAFVPGLGISQATAALVGQSLGASNAAGARATARSSMFLCCLVMATLGFALIAGAYPIVGLFDIEAGTALESYSVQWMIVLGCCMPLVGIYAALFGTLQGAGATNTSLVINIIGTVFVLLPAAALLGFFLGLGVLGVWLGFLVNFIAKVLLAGAAYRRGSWAKLGSNVLGD